MFVTVAICTWNRSKLLDQTLLKMSELKIPAGVTWELLVVDNNSPDDTSAVIQKHQALGRLPLKPLFEPKQGLCAARNCAIAAAQGSLILWTDDDVLVDDDWLIRYTEAALAYPDAAFFGGTVDPWFERPPPRWVQRYLDRLIGPFAIRQFGPEVRPLVERECPFGANMAIRTELIRRYMFDPKIGHQGHLLMGGDETRLFEQMQGDGLTGVWVGTARVRHYIPKERLTVAFLWRWFHGFGARDVRLEGASTSTIATLFGRPRFAVRLYLTNLFWFWMLRPFKTGKWFSAFQRGAIAEGVMRAFREHRTTATV